MLGYIENSNLGSKECHQAECHGLEEIQVLLYIRLAGDCCAMS